MELSAARFASNSVRETISDLTFGDNDAQDGAVSEIRRALSRGQLLELVTTLETGDDVDRLIAALLTIQASFAKDDLFSIVSRRLHEERVPAIRAALVTAGAYSFDERLLPLMQNLVMDLSDLVRFQVATALVMTGGVSAGVIWSLLSLSRDSDSEVRWSAAYELCVIWNGNHDSTIKEQLDKLAEFDSSLEVREVIRLTLDQ